jgi:hypothetical protein
VNRQCILHGAGGQLQMTLSWDDPEDLDLHVYEPQASQPGGFCEIWYGNVGNREYTDGGADPSGGVSGCTPIGWLDRDSNPACEFDNVDIENVIYPYDNATPPSGTYTVLADYYADCAGQSDTLADGGTIQSIPDYPQVNYAIQVRRNGAVYQYCRSFSPNDADGSGPCNAKTDGGSSDGAGGGFFGGGVTCTMVDTFTLP